MAPEAEGVRVEGGGWKAECGVWKMEGGVWSVEDGRWRVEGGRWRVEGGGLKHISTVRRHPEEVKGNENLFPKCDNKSTTSIPMNSTALPHT